MRNIRFGALLALAAIAAAAGLSALVSAHGASAQSSDTVVRVAGPTGEVKKGDDGIPFEVSV
jgi:hypothetical protein